jgi:putative oxidoreductase
MENYSYPFAELFLRIILGIVFTLQGFDKIFVVGIGKVSETFKEEFRQKSLPGFIFPLTAVYSSLIEFCGGILILLGLFKMYAVIFLCLDLALVTVAFSLLDPGGNLKMIFPRIVLMIFLLMMPADIEYWTLDSFLKK